jgi:ParB family chromosome partitioning protein
MAAHGIKPSLSQAVRLKKIKQSETLTIDAINEILSENKKPPKNDQSENASYRGYFPESYSQKQIDDVIIGLLKDWQTRTAV